MLHENVRFRNCTLTSPTQSECEQIILSQRKQREDMRKLFVRRDTIGKLKSGRSVTIILDFFISLRISDNFFDSNLALLVHVVSECCTIGLSTKSII